MRRLALAWICLALLGVWALGACGSQKCTGFGSNCEDVDGSSADGNPNGDGTTNPFGDTGAGDGSSCDLHCSADLHDILDCNDKVVTTCPADQGCGGNTCVAACDAAKANKSSVGCEYYSIDPDIITAGYGACFAAFVANTWNAPVTLQADWGGQPLSIATIARAPNGSGQSLTYQALPNNQLPVGGIAVLFFNRYGTTSPPPFDFDCPSGVTPGVTSVDAATHGTGFGKPFHIIADHPIVAYDMFPFGGGQSAATSATLLVPTSAWDVNYIAVNAFRKDQFVAEAQPFLEIVASQDTNVTIRPTAAIVGGGGVAAAPANAPAVYALKAGQYMQITQDAELTGSAILADHPVGVWGGATCLNIDVNDQACDSAHQQLFPVSALGHEYVGVRYRNRGSGPDESVPWRIVGAVDGTQLSYEPSTPTGAPGALNHGQVAEFWAPGPFVVKSQDDKHPFYVSAHMTGGDQVSPQGRGDPEFVNVLPPQEYLASYVFFTDPTYPETNLVVVRTKGSNGFADVNLDCAGNLTGWQPVGTSGKYEFTRVDLQTGNFQKVGSCDNGRHTITSTLPFGLTVWGWGSELATTKLSTWVSYAYPAGASVQPINTVIVNPNVN